MHIFTKKIVRFFLFTLMLLFSSLLQAQVPANDEPCNATVLTPTASCNYLTFTTVDASDSQAPGIPNPIPFIACGPYAGSDVWFITTVPVGATSMVIDTKNITMSDGAMTVYTATSNCPTVVLAQIACADDGSSNPGMPQIVITQPAGTVLYIRLYGVGGELGTFGICVTANIPPVNDDCTNAISLTLNADYNCGIILSGQTTINATQSPNTPLPTCSGSGTNDDVWYSFTATSTDHRISLGNLLPTTSNMAIAVYTGLCIGLTQQSCTSFANVANLTGLTAGTIYFVRVYTTSSTTTTNASFSICVGTLPPPPLNDNCPGAIVLTVNPTLICTTLTSGTTQSATLSAVIPDPSCGNANGWNDDVWFSFTAISTSHRVTLSNISPAATGMVVEVYSGNCFGFVPVLCSMSPTTSMVLTGLTPGLIYYARVFTNSSLPATVANFDICVTTPPPPPINDECIAAIPLTVNATLVCTATTIGTTQSGTQSVFHPVPSCGVSNANNDDVWFSFIATSATHLISLPTVAPTGTGMVIVAYTGSCASLFEIGCSTSSPLGLFGLTIGNTYFVRVFTNSSGPLIYSDFTICVTTPPPPPANDECISAISMTVNPDYLCGVVTAGNTQYATPSTTAPAPTCSATGINDDVWFSFIATGVSHRINVLNIVGSASLTKVVYSGTCGALTQINCTTTNIFNVNALTIGNTYYVRVFTTSSNVSESATFNICIGSPPPPPLNDNCTGAVNLTVNANLLCGVSTLGTITSATSSTGTPVPSCAATGVDDDVWYQFTATNTTHRITLTNITPTTTMAVVVYSGTCTSLTEIFCNTTNLLNASGLIIGQTYYVRVYSTGITPNLEVDFRVCVGTLPPPPPNDECTGAISLPISTNLTCANPTSGTTLSATQSTNLPAPTCGGTNGWNDDVWYSIVATSTSHRISLTNITGPTNALVTTVYSGTCGALTLLACNTANAFDANNLTIGNTYYIRIHTSVSTFEDASFNICIGSPAPNTTCSTSIPFCNQVSNEINFVSTQGITAGGSISCLGTTPNRNWFDIVVLTPGPIFIEISQTGGNVSNDVDFAAWGPYTTPSEACTAITAGAPTVPNIPNTVPTATHTQGGCSYSAAAIEYFKIPNALPGQVYKLLVTNFSTSNNNLPPFTTPAQFVRLRSMIPISNGGATLDCNVPCFSATATNSGPVCGGGTFNLFSTGSTTPFNWTSPTGFTSTTQNPTGVIAPTAAGNYDYTVTIGIGTGACVKTTTLVVTTPPSAPTLPSPLPTYCQGATNAVALTATASAGNTLQWYNTLTGGTSVTSIIPNTTATITYYVTQITAGGCESSPRTPVTVTITPAPAAPTVTSPVTYCQNETTVAPLSAIATAGNTILYYTLATGGTGVTTLTPSATTAGTFTYYAEQVTSNGCTGLRSLIDVIVNARPAPPTTTAQMFCEGATLAPLTAGGIAAGANVLWYTVLTGGSAIPTPTPSNTVSSTYYVTQILNGCESTPRTALVTTITPTPAAPTVSTIPIVYCEGATNAVPLIATASGTNTLLWYTVATGGTSSPTLTPNTTATTTYYVSQITSVGSGGCESARTPLTVTITPTPAAPVVTSPVTYCQDETPVAPLSATATAGNSILYYTTATGGTGVISLIPDVTTAGTFTYYAEQVTSNGCTGLRSLIDVIVNARPAPPTTTAQMFCEGATLAPLTAGGIAAGANVLWYTVLTGGSAIPTPTPSNTVSSTYYVTQILNGCESTPRTSVNTTITPTPVKPTVNSPVKLCPNEVALPLTATPSTGNSLLWYLNFAGTASSTAPIPITSVQGTFNYYVSQITSNGCEGPKELIVITVSNNSLFVDAGPNTTICQDRKIKLLPTVSSPLATFEWRAVGVPPTTIDSIFIQNPTVSPVDTAEYIVRASLNGCFVEDAIKVNVIWKPVIDAGKNIPICLNDSVLLKGAVTHLSNNNVEFLWTSVPADTLNTPTDLQTYAHPLTKTLYRLTAFTDSLKYGCDFTVYDSMIVAIQPIIKAFAGRDTIAAKGSSHQLHGTGGLNYEWSSPTGINIASAFSQNAYVNLNNDGNFYLRVTDAVGCEGFDSIFVKVYNGNTYFVPNSFTPNGDGLNDIFRAISVGMSNTVYFRVFNRYGELMFETNQYLKGWDGTYKGKPQPNGVYVWMVGGTDKDKKKVFMEGTVMLIR